MLAHTRRVSLVHANQKEILKKKDWLLVSSQLCKNEMFGQIVANCAFGYASHAFLMGVKFCAHSALENGSVIYNYKFSLIYLPLSGNSISTGGLGVHLAEGGTESGSLPSEMRCSEETI